MNFRVFNPDDSEKNTSHRQTARSRAMQRVRKNRLAAGGETIGGEPIKRLTMADIRKGAHRTTTPVRTVPKTRDISHAPKHPPADVTPLVSEASTPVLRPLAVDPRILELSAQVTAQTVRLVVPGDQRQAFGQLPIRQWYHCELYGPAVQRLKDLSANKIAVGTAEKDLSAISVWERFTRPADWIGDWPGISIASITHEYLRSWISTALQAGLSKGYLEGIANHIHGMLTLAVEREVIGKVPKKPPVKAIAATMANRLFADDDLTVIFEIRGDILHTLDRIHAELADDFELQTAFVLACSTGLRPRDLFALSWSDLIMIDGSPAIYRVPEKTKRHGTTVRIPLAPCIASRLAELRRRAGADGTSPAASGPSAADSTVSARIFPRLVSEDCTDPEHSRAARRRNAAIRAAAQRAGFAFPANRDKPWQIARATCNERLERHCPGIGPFILGHSARGTNAKSYRQRWSEAVQAVESLPQPLSFLSVPEPQTVLT
jgi:integrase